MDTFHAVTISPNHRIKQENQKQDAFGEVAGIAQNETITVYYDYISIILHHDCIIGRNVVSCSARQQSIFTLSKSLAAPEDLSMIRGFEIKT